MGTGLHGYMVTWVQGYMVTWLQGYRVTGLHGYRVTWTRGHRGNIRAGWEQGCGWEDLIVGCLDAVPIRLGCVERLLHQLVLGILAHARHVYGHVYGHVHGHVCRDVP